MIPMISSSSAGRPVLVWIFAFFLLGSYFAAAAQAPSSSGDSAPAQSSPEKQPDKPTDATAAPAQPKKPHHVITDEDMAAYHSRNPDGSLNGGKSTRGIPATGLCDDECAEEARQMMGFGPDREGEWRIQLATARKSLGEDTEWPAAYAQAARAVETYCTFQYQQEAAALPSGNDWASQVERAKREKYAEEMGRVLMQNVTNANARVNQLIQQAEDGEPVRAAIMRVLASRVTDSCPDDP